MKPIRKKLLAAACAAGLVVLLAGCQSPEDKAQTYVREARELLAGGNTEKAVVQLRNALKLDARNVDAYLMLAEIAEKNGEWPVVHRRLGQVIEIEPNHVVALTKLTQLYLLGDDIERAGKTFATLETAAPDDPKVLMLRAMMLARQGDREGALKQAERAYTAAPEDRDILAGYVAAQLAAGQLDAALQTVDAGLTRREGDEGLRVLRFRVLAAKGSVDEAAAALRELATSRPGQLQYWRLLALYHARNGKPENAEAALREAVQANPENPGAKLMLASYLGQRDQTAAIEALKSFIADESGASPELKFALAETYVRNEAIDQAIDVYQDLAVSAPSAAQQNAAKNQLARIALKGNDKDEAVKIITEILAADPRNADALVARALVALGERRTADAITDLRLAIREKPKDDRAMVLLANAYVQDSALELAEESVFQALQTNPLNADAAIMYARMRLQKQDFKGALGALDRLLSGGVNNTEAEGLRIQIRLTQKDWKAATDLADGVSRSTSNPLYARYILALTLFGQERYQESIELLEEVLAADDTMQGALSGIARAHRAAGQPEQGIAFLRQYTDAHAGNVAARMLLAEELVRSADNDGAIAVYRGIIASKPDTIGAYRSLSALQTRIGRTADAEQTLRGGLASNPGSLDLKLQLAMACERDGKADEAVAVYRELLEKVPTLDVAANNLAVLLAGDGSDKARLEEAARIASRFESSQQPWFADTLGWIYFQQGNFSKAADLLGRAVKTAPTQGLFQYHLGATLFELKDFAGAIRYLKEAERLAAAGEGFDGVEQARALLARAEAGG